MCPISLSSSTGWSKTLELALLHHLHHTTMDELMKVSLSVFPLLLVPTRRRRNVSQANQPRRTTIRAIAQQAIPPPQTIAPG